MLQVTDLEDGKIQVKINGKVVVDASGASYTNDKLNIGSDGVTLTWNSNNQNANLGAGAIRGFTDMLTGADPINAGIPYYQNKMDNFARPWQMCLTIKFMRMTLISLISTSFFSREVLTARLQREISASVTSGPMTCPT